MSHDELEYLRKANSRLSAEIRTLWNAARGRKSHIATPIWANGEEWSGFKWRPRTQTMMAWSGLGLLEICEDGILAFEPFSDDSIQELPLESVALALSVARLILDAHPDTTGEDDEEAAP